MNHDREPSSGAAEREAPAEATRRTSRSRLATPPPPIPRRRSIAAQRGCARPQCTDSTALLASIVFNLYLAWLARTHYETGDIRRLTHGIDFRGQICGIGESVEDRDKKAGDYLYWCHEQGKVQLDAPICVYACPTGGEQLLCPVPVQPPEDSRENVNGEFLLKRVHVQRLVPRSALPTRQSFTICVPEHISPQMLFDLITKVASRGSSLVLRAAHLAKLGSTPRLMVVLTAMATLSGLMYIFFLRVFMRAFTTTLMVLSCMFFVAVGSFLLARTCSAEVCQNVHSAAVHVVKNGQPNGTAAQATGMFQQVVSIAQAHLSFVNLGPSASAFLGALSLIIGLWVLPWFYHANRQKMSLAVYTVRQGCTIMFNAPVLTVLPVFEFTLRAGLLVLTCAGALFALSTADVHANPVSIFGDTIAGIVRSFSITGELVVGLVSYSFALVWYQEVVSAVFTYVIARTTALSYFSVVTRPPTETTLETLLAVLHHIGSFAKGATENTCRYIPRWLGVASADHSYAYVDMAITSANLESATLNASKLLSGSGMVRATRGMLLGPIMQLYAVVFVAVLYLLVNTLLLLAQGSLRVPEASRNNLFWSVLVGLYGFLARNMEKITPLVVIKSALFDSLLEELEDLESSATAAAVTAAMSYLIVQSFTMVINQVADAVLYCSLVEQQSGTVVEEVPEEMRNMANYQANTQQFLCPITYEIMTDPVVAADGHTYDRSSIERWLSQSNRSPMTLLPLPHCNLVPNIVLRQQIEALQEGDA